MSYPSPRGVRRRALLVATVAASGLLSEGAWAQTSPPGTAAGEAPVAIGTLRVEGEGATGFTVQTPVDTGYRASRTVSATRTETELLDTPQAVSVVTRQEIEDRAAQSMADVVRYVPGVSFAQGEGNRDAPVFRGNTSTSDFFVDGVRDDVQYFRDLYNIERVEVLRGPNAMIFGRGGAGGLINRVTRQADWTPRRELRLEAGSFDHYRTTFDLGAPVSDRVALRLTGLVQDSGSYRDGVTYEKFGLNPTGAVLLGDSTLLQLGYEYFTDERVADRGVPSLRGRPLETDDSVFFGDPGRSPTDVNVNVVTAALEHRFAGGAILRNRTRFGDYDKFYQNVYPGAVSADATTVALLAYNVTTDRENLFNQTDLNLYLGSGPVRHTVLLGAELGRQESQNTRLTGFFNNTAASIQAPLSNPTVSVPLTFRPNATDPSNDGTVTLAALYAQDQIEISERLQLILGLRYDRFAVDFLNRRSGVRIETEDDLWSPRAGLVFKPRPEMSLYGSYTMTHAPRAGEQLTSLTLSNAALEPETFENYEVGAKWDVNPDLQVSAALFRLDRSNVAVPDPADPVRSLLVDGQRTQGLELSATGQITPELSVIAAYSYQDGEITRAESAAVPAGSKLANLPEHTLALWGRYEATDALAAALGFVYEDERLAQTGSAVLMPSYTRLDGALFYDLSDRVSVQINVENLLGEEYFAWAHNSNNITPGSPRAVKLGLTARY
jgi:catecholate siderophore receptor